VGTDGGCDDSIVVAIDGPGGVGKTTVAAEVARRIGGFYFDTGVVYRALALIALERGVGLDDEARLAMLARALSIRVTPPSRQDGRRYDVWLDGRDITWDIRAPEIDRAASHVASFPQVRAALLPIQRAIGRSSRVVMAGRDIGTVVMPDAPVKVWLDASLEERARRRQRDLEARGIVVSREAVVAELAERDRRDAERAVAPMRPARDAVVIDTDGRSVEDVVGLVLELIEERCGSAGRVEQS
jgi:cytidylate kinase